MAWPYKQPKNPDWGSMKSPLRRAARHYKDVKYEKALCTILQVRLIRFSSNSILS